MRLVSETRSYFFLKGPKQPLRLCPHCTSTSRNVTSLMTARFGTKRRTKGIVTNHGMPVRWSTAHYRFSRAPCTATLYRPPSLARSFVSFPLSLSPSTSLPSTDDFPVSLSLCRSFPITLSLFHQPPFLLFLFSTIIPSLPSNGHRLTRARTLFHGAVCLYVSTRNARCFSSLSFMRRPPLRSDNRLLSLAPSSLASPSPAHYAPSMLATHPLDPSRSTSRRRVASLLVSSVFSSTDPLLSLLLSLALSLFLPIKLHSAPCRPFE